VSVHFVPPGPRLFAGKRRENLYPLRQDKRSSQAGHPALPPTPNGFVNIACRRHPIDPERGRFRFGLRQRFVIAVRHLLRGQAAHVTGCSRKILSSPQRYDPQLRPAPDKDGHVCSDGRQPEYPSEDVAGIARGCDHKSQHSAASIARLSQLGRYSAARGSCLPCIVIGATHPKSQSSVG